MEKISRLSGRQLASYVIGIVIVGIAAIAIVQAAGKPALNNGKLLMKAGQSKTLKVKNASKKKVKKIIFSSNNKSVAKVTKNGKVTAIKSGKAAIICKLVMKTGKRYTLKCNVTVEAKGAEKPADSVGKPYNSTGKPADSAGKPASSTAAVLSSQRPSVTPKDEPEDSMPPESGEPVVYMTKNISSKSLLAIYKALNASPSGNIAVKISTGETGSNYLRTDLIGALVQSLHGTIVECNTAYGGSRASTAAHYQIAKDHGYTDIAEVDIMDEDGSMTLPVTGGKNLKENYVGKNFAKYDYYVVLSHFKGHAMAGFGGAIKNISIGIASSDGKAHIHSGGTGGSMWGGEQDAFLESMAEAGKSVVDYLKGNILYINVMNRLSVDCDCDSSPAEPDMHDIGILASYDPVALDQACVDLVYRADDGASLIKRIESRNGLHTLEHAEKIGLGSRTYRVVNID